MVNSSYIYFTFYLKELRRCSRKRDDLATNKISPPAKIPVFNTPTTMSGKGLGQPQPTKIDKLVESAVRDCHKRHPEALDQIFDNLPVKLNQQVLDGTVATLKKDIDSLSWLCGYFASEINSTSDNDKPYHSTF